MKGQHYGHYQVVIHLYILCLRRCKHHAGFSNVTLQAAVPVVISADLHSRCSPRQGEPCFRDRLQPSSKETTKTQSSWKNTGGFLLHGNHFTVFHQILNFQELLLWLELILL